MGYDLKRFSGALFFVQLLLLGSAFALPAMEPEYVIEYEKIRKEIHSKDFDLLEEAYKSKNDFLRHISHPQATKTEYYLTNVESGYGFFSPNTSLRELEELIERTQSSRYSMDSAQRELILGDAYHWLGHTYEEKGELTKPYECYVRSHVHYQKTPIQRSPRINPRLIIQEHGFFHLKNIRETINSFVNLPGFGAQICISLFN